MCAGLCIVCHSPVLAALVAMLTVINLLGVSLRAARTLCHSNPPQFCHMTMRPALNQSVRMNIHHGKSLRLEAAALVHPRQPVCMFYAHVLSKAMVPDIHSR